MKIELREKEGITIADVDGRLVIGDGATLFRETLKNLFDSGVKRLLLNLAEVPYIDSTGLGALVMCSTSAANAGGAIKLLNLTSRAMELLVITKLETIFEVFDNEQDAVNSFFPDRKIQHFDILSFVHDQQEKEEENQ